jgi:type VI secretion system protein ImpL
LAIGNWQLKDMSTSWHKSQLSYAIGLSSIMTFYGIVSILSYYAGDALGYGITYRLIVIGLVLLTLPFALVAGYFAQRKLMKSQEAEEKAQQEGEQKEQAKGAAGAAQPSDDVSKNAQEAVQWLRSTKLAGSADAVYALPWYVTAGPTRSGKTSLIISSALDFQTLPSQRQTEQNVVRPTKNAEWRMTSSAVFVDTSGRYQSEGEEGEEWAGILEAIKKVRGSRPLDGLIVPVSAERLLRLNENEIEQQAKTIRTRIDEVMQRTKLKFPVYLIFTHADAIEGFKDFFSISQKENKRYVWGATIPLEKAANAHALFDVEYDLLYSALMKRRLFRLANPFPPVRLLRIFNFPQRFADARRKLGLFNSVLFRPNPFSESPLFRGFYFTANLQPTAHPRTAGVESPDSDSPKSVGQGWFVEKFFKDVLLRDKDMVASFQSQKTGPPIFSALCFLLLLFIGFLWLFGTGVSFVANRKFVDESVAVGKTVSENTIKDRDKDPQSKAESDVREELTAINELRERLVLLDNYDQKRPPFYMRFGLYSGGSASNPDSLNARLRNTYFEAIRRRFNKPTFEALEKDLRAFVAGNPSPIPDTEISDKSKGASDEEKLGYHYDLLKAYLMLTGDDKYRDKVEGTFLTKRLEMYWKKCAPPSSEALAAKQLEFFANSVGRDESWISRVKSDQTLIDDVRKKLQAFPVFKRYYKNITTEISNKAKPVTLDGILAGRGGGVMSSNFTVRGAYTLEGYRDYVKEAIDKAAQEMSKEDWVMGNVGSNAAAQSGDIAKLKDLYQRDYIDEWRNMIRSVRVEPYTDKDKAVDSLTAFSNTDSPMELFMQEVARQTFLSYKPKNEGWIEYFRKLISGTPEITPEEVKDIENEYRPIVDFAGANLEDTKSAPISTYRSEIQKVKDKLKPMNKTQLDEVQNTILTSGSSDKLGLSNAELKISNMLDSFKTASAAEAASLLKRPLENLRGMLTKGNLDQIVAEWNNIFPIAQTLEKSGFPFGGTTDLPLADLNSYLSPAEGRFSRFFDQKLKSSFEESQGEFKPKQGGAFKFSDDFNTYINNAMKLRDALYPSGSSAPSFKYAITLKSVRDGSATISIDGVSVTAPDTTTAFQWPGTTGTKGATISVAMNDGTTKQLQPFTGDWGLFKLFRAASSKKVGANQYELQWDVQGVKVMATLQTEKSNSPFEQSLFTNFRAPQNIKP